MATHYDKQYNPDVLSCIANLSNDEVFTPPELVNKMLDLLPQELFENPDTTFLDPACKSGVFLREIAKRLVKGLERQMPDLDRRLEHIFTKQLFGIAVTELTGMLSRRSLYCSKFPDGPYSICQFDDKHQQGNIIYKNIKHTWEGDKCKYCGASKNVYDRNDDMESYAYQFIHTSDATKLFNMRFDVIIGNPPYQLSSNDSGIQATPLYHMFIQQSKKLNPRYISMIIPARWYSGGMGMNSFRTEMLEDKRISYLHDYPKSRDCFAGVDIAGGVCYFLWDRDKTSSKCIIVNQVGESINQEERPLNEYPIFVRDNIGIHILRKILAKHERLLSEIVYPISPFGLPTSFRGTDKPFKDCLTLISSEGRSFIRESDVSDLSLAKKYKVSIGQLNPDRAGVNNASDGKMSVTTKVQLYAPNEVTTATYLILGAFGNENEARNYVSYIKCRLTRFLIAQTLSSMHITRNNFIFVPSLDFSMEWTDEKLYKKYNLTGEEIAFIESMIKPME